MQNSLTPGTMKPPVARLVRWGIGLGLVALLSFGVFSKFGPKESTSGLREAPAFKLPIADGKSFELSSLKDHVVVVHFWAAWCPPCLPEIPEILGAAKKLPKDQDGKPIYWVFITQDPDWEKAHKILPESMLTENVISVIDADAKISDLYGSYQFPETYLVNRDGEIAAKWIGPQEWSAGWGDQALYGIETLSRTKALPTTMPTGK